MFEIVSKIFESTLKQCGAVEGPDDKLTKSVVVTDIEALDGIIQFSTPLRSSTLLDFARQRFNILITIFSHASMSQALQLFTSTDCPLQLSSPYYRSLIIIRCSKSVTRILDSFS